MLPHGRPPARGEESKEGGEKDLKGDPAQLHSGVSGSVSSKEPQRFGVFYCAGVSLNQDWQMPGAAFIGFMYKASRLGHTRELGYVFSSPYLTLAFCESCRYLNIDFSACRLVHSFLRHLLCNRHHTQTGNTDGNEKDTVLAFTALTVHWAIKATASRKVGAMTGVLQDAVTYGRVTYCTDKNKGRFTTIVTRKGEASARCNGQAWPSGPGFVEALFRNRLCRSLEARECDVKWLKGKFQGQE